jgi:hypothetical protein
MTTMTTTLLTGEQTCEALGHIGRTTLHRLTVAGEVRSVRIGKRRMYLADSVEALLARRAEGGDPQPGQPLDAA